MTELGQDEEIDRSAHLEGAEGAVLRADDLIAGYVPGVNILNGADLYCQEQELVGIIGPNGAGKSTLLKALFGLVKIRTGTVTLKGDDITNQRADVLVTKGIGFVPQTNNVFPSLTIQENLEMGVYQRPKSFKARFEFVGDLFPALIDRRAQRAGSLSGGERQMVAMGRALMMEPSVLLLDEPSAGLSPVMQDEVFVQTRRINRAGRLGGHGRAERQPVPADLRPRLRPGPRPQRLHGHGCRAGQGPQGHRALPRHAREGLSYRSTSPPEQRRRARPEAGPFSVAVIRWCCDQLMTPETESTCVYLLPLYSWTPMVPEEGLPVSFMSVGPLAPS